VTTPSAAPGRAEPVAAAGLSFDHVQMTFPDGTEAVADATFRVKRGEFVTVVGPSGCGKSTLLRVASGLLEATGGSVNVESSGTDRQRIGYVFQDPTLMPWRTVRGNVELLAELDGLPRAERQRLGQQAIDLVGLTGFEHHYPKSLSGGMRMRCSLARTLTLQPPIMLFDEPFGAVDEITRERLNEETLRLFEDQRFAGVFITHSISEAVFLSSRVLVMSPRPGRIIAEVDVPFPYPRDPDLRFDPQFAAVSAEVSHTLRAGGQ
jgi:NitT/TauT family transport system ATP-binding protein